MQGQVVAGVLLGLAGIGVVDVYTIVNRRARRKGSRAHWAQGLLLAVPGMTAMGCGWGLLCLAGPRVWLPGGLAAGGLLCVFAAGLYFLSARRVGRLQSPSKYTLQLHTQGIYRWVRHPQALALCILCVGLGLVSRSEPYLWTLPLWIANWVLYTYFEEHFELIPTFGEEYLRYSEQTARLLPGIF